MSTTADPRSQGRAASVLPAAHGYTTHSVTSNLSLCQPCLQWCGWHQSIMDVEICTILCREGPDEQGDVLKGTVEGQKSHQIHGNDRGFVQCPPKLWFLSSRQPPGHFPYVNNQTVG